MQVRHIIFEHAHKFRDLGGYPGAEGRVTRWGRLYRSDALSELTKEEWEQVRNEQGVDLVIDLRSKPEREKSPVRQPEGITLRAYSLMQELDTPMQPAGADTPMPAAGEDVRAAEAETGRTAGTNVPMEISEGDASAQILESMKLDYTKTLFGNLPCAAEILNLILTHLQNGSGSIVFLCSAGKDRTGITAALLLYLCGVSDEDIIADYMVSGIYNENGINKNMESLPQELLKMIPNPEILKQSLASDPETMRALLASFKEKDICARLDENGFSGEKQQALRMAMTEA